MSWRNGRFRKEGVQCGKVEGKKGGDPGSLGQDGKNAGRGRPEHLA